MHRAQTADFITEAMAEALLDRLSIVQRDFDDILLVGRSLTMEKALAERGRLTICAPNAADLPADAVQAAPDALPFAAASFDLVVNIGLLDSCNDVPGALILSRRALRPDGLFLASLIGAGSLQALRESLLRAEGDRAAPHFHPLIDVRTGGDLLMRAGFTLPVADSEKLQLEYASAAKLIADLRDYGGTNILADGPSRLRRETYDRLIEGWARTIATQGHFPEALNLLFLLGWAPHPDQPKPARRGSGTASLGDALKPR